MKNFGESVLKFRNQINLTQEELAKKSKLHITTIKDIETNVLSPTLDTVKKIVDALNLNLSDFFDSNKEERFSKKLYQPIDGNLGNYLISEIVSGEYRRITILSAYAKKSGVDRIKDVLLKFKKEGGEIRCIIGIDQMNTSYEALQDLLLISDSLIIVHNENPSSTYHSKVYMLDKNIKSSNKVWLAIGSNNLTAGGLFINYESCVIDQLDLNNKTDKDGYESTKKAIKYFLEAKNSGLSLHIDSEDILNKLLTNKYIKKENELKLSLKNEYKDSDNNIIREKLFKSDFTFKAPTISDDIKVESSILVPAQLIELKSTEKVLEENSKEIFWFEMRKSTGGSRNILDLSSTAKLLYGDVTPDYLIENSKNIKGGLLFFDLDSSEQTITKNITISYKENKYYPSTILYADNNKSWRLQLKGKSSSDTKALSQYGKTDFVDNILIFTKISTDFYILEILDNNQLEALKNKSIFYALNGHSKNSKMFGKLK